MRRRLPSRAEDPEDARILSRERFGRNRGGGSGPQISQVIGFEHSNGLSTVAVQQYIRGIDSSFRARLLADGDDLQSVIGLSNNAAGHEQQRAAVELEMNAVWHPHIRESLREGSMNRSDDIARIQ